MKSNLYLKDALKQDKKLTSSKSNPEFPKKKRTEITDDKAVSVKRLEEDEIKNLYKSLKNTRLHVSFLPRIFQIFLQGS